MWFAIAFAFIATFINIVGVNSLGRFNNYALAFILILIAYILISSTGNIADFTSTPSKQAVDTLSFTKVWAAASIIFWAFRGWENLTFGNSEIEKPNVNIPRIFWISFLSVSLIYALFALSISSAFEAGQDVSRLNGLVSFLPSGLIGKVLLFAMIVVLLANANSWVFGASRAFFFCARSRLLDHPP